MNQAGILSRIKKYPRLVILILTFIISAIFFTEAHAHPELNEFLISLGYSGTFFAGMLYAYGFTSAPATAILLILAEEQNIFLAGLIGGIGALLSDLILYLFVRNIFADEIERLRSKSVLFGKVNSSSNKSGKPLKRYLMMAIGGFLIASPLPTEIGITLMASMKNLGTARFLAVAYPLHTAGIFMILFAGIAIDI
jgi:hypothetical protein